MRPQFVANTDREFPRWLREIPDPPNGLYWLGHLQCVREPGVAIVGARQCSHLGRGTARSFGAAIAEAGHCVVSGLAHGIDTAAHEGALDAGGPTVAVLGSGVDVVYPARNAKLAERIVRSGGALLSEYPPGTRPAKHRFPQRNRIISGLCRAVVVVEASERSGSLITARLALEQGRDVLAVPGAINTAVSVGCHRLLRDGAALVDSIDALAFELGLEQAQVAPEGDSCASLSEAQELVLAAVDAGLRTPEKIAASSACELTEVLAELTELELLGFVTQLHDGYSRRPV